ncbi:hypothetical protein PVAG01_06792 [Phlyctema vagabunda]|uniref:AB hydrolase-1 domain-containing protein n=1 Tax=Phlyctema vagabunda TaxID=108571 RepID=A0ABR4PH24_9HELO
MMSQVDLQTFSFTRLVRDAVILVNALGYEKVACVIGHDFGAVAASMCALVRPDIFTSVVTMAHPFKGPPSLPFNTTSPPPPAPDVHQALAALPQPRKHYKWYYSTAAAAKEMDEPKSGMHEFLRTYFYLKSADWKGNDPYPLKAWEASELARMPYYYVMPLESGMREAVSLPMALEDPALVEQCVTRWLPDEDLAVYVSEWSRNGFQGGLNWYRVATDPKYMKDIELFAGRKIDVPAMLISGKQDWATYQEPGVMEKMGDVCTQFHGSHVVEGAGHWVQQEQPERLVELLEKFLLDIKTQAMSY